MSVDLSKGATVELVKTLSDDLRTKNDNTKATSAGAAVRAIEGEVADLKTATSQIPTGSYPEMAVGEVFSDDSYTEDKTPYLYRVSGGGVEVGKVEANQIVGGSIAWNQLVQEINADNWVNERATAEFSNGEAVCRELTSTWGGIRSRELVPAINNHKYLMSIVARAVNSGETVTIATGYGGTVTVLANVTTTNNSQYTTIVSATADTSVYVNVSNRNNTNSFAVSKLQIIDLTQMFGTTIADYIYTLEQTTAGAGVAWFKKLFPEPYYPYNSGELLSVSGLQSHDMVGFNQWDEEWESGTILPSDGQNSPESLLIRCKNYIPVVSSTAYCLTCPDVARVFFYDRNRNYLSYIDVPTTFKTFTTPSNCGYIRFRPGSTYGTTYKNDMCINLSSSRNGEYEPYVKHSYQLDSSLTLRGIPKVADGKMYYDGDIYSADGKVQRKYGIVDLGALNWTPNNTSESGVMRMVAFNLQTLNMKGATNLNTVPNALCTKIYAAETPNETYSKVPGITISTDGSAIYVYDPNYNTSSSAASFKASMSGVYLVYELATPTEETAQPFTEYQKVSKYGTEEYVSTSIVPVGHVTKYPTDIVAKVDGLPSDFSTLIAPTESAMKATRAYTVNQFLIVSNQLYRVTAAIASGATITPNTNVTAVTVADILTSLLNA